MSPDAEKRIARLAGDRESGASEILATALTILREALETGADLVEVARALCRAQPSMAPMWNAATAALAARDDPAALERFAQRVARAPYAIERFAAEPLLAGVAPDATLRVVTISFSATVAHVLEGLARRRPIIAACGEGRPALEGRHLASRLAAAGVPVACFADGAIGHALETADAVITGADAVAPEWFFNKSGTYMLAAAAGHRGVPVYVLAGREKFVSDTVARHLAVREGLPDEVWAEPPAGVAVRNPYFEAVPLHLMTAVITDVGILGADNVRELCETLARSTPPSLLECLV